MQRTPLDDSLKVSRNQPTLREMVLDKLRQAIMSFQLLPGDRLVERDLCKRLGVSRTSVREALRHLEAEGLVESEGGRGPRVAVITLEDARDIYELRCVLESMVVQLFTQKATDKQMADFDHAWEILKATLRSGDTVAIVNAVSDFYGVLYEGAGNRVAGQFLSLLQARVNYLRATSVSQKERYLDSFQEMTKIVEAIKARNAEAAHEACVEHIKAAANVALAALAEKQGESVEPISPPVSVARSLQ
ncbi:GntR family transcriptional regulator [Marinobacter manganoxydans]|uniref:GntR family transcriptional regulator n=1 Tax=Marinobacter manganoxydans MnI7-9 TaxID=1094979 RepID=G6YNE6_9GAMM|nr:GntR family transcriptional regulator [Marinobacter manganoxydans]EHJ06323.1 GntR family transcriptional regulator [Marinobacter manganoxydans MnI7-9]